MRYLGGTSIVKRSERGEKPKEPQKSFRRKQKEKKRSLLYETEIKLAAFTVFVLQLLLIVCTRTWNKKKNAKSTSDRKRSGQMAVFSRLSAFRF